MILDNSRSKVKESTFTIVLFVLYFLFAQLHLRVFAKAIVSFFEFGLLAGVLILFLLNSILNNFLILKKKALVLDLFLYYIFIHIIYSLIYHHIISGLSFTQSLISVLFQFKVGLLGYFLVHLFKYLHFHEDIKLANVLIGLMKVAVIYTFCEQFISLIGFRTLIESYLRSTGVVSGNLIGLKSMGLYRIWGIVGSTQLLGVFHCIFLSYILGSHVLNKKWFILCVVAIILATSKTGYVILVFLILFDSVIKKRYLILFLFGMIILLLTIVIISYVDIGQIGNFVDSFTNFFLIIIDAESVPDYNNGISIIPRFIYDLKHYSPLFGKGVTFNYAAPGDMPNALLKYQSFAGDYYFLSFINSFGFVGYILLLFTFLIIPVKNVFKRVQLQHSYTLLVFFLATTHYEPQINKLLMFYFSFSLYKIYIGKSNNYEIII